MIYSDNLIIAKTEEDIRKLLLEYNCNSVDDLADLLWFTYGVTLIDKTNLSDYSQVEAQNSPEFYSEEMVASDLNPDILK